MPNREEISYFGAGPAGLPTQSIQSAAEAFVNYEATGLGLAEISHRSSTANTILAEAKDSLRSLLAVPDEYEIIFAHGGGSGAFASVVLNLVGHWAEQVRKLVALERPQLSDEQIRDRVRNHAKTLLRLDYLVTGSWSLKASQEAADLLSLLGPDIVNVATDSRNTQESGRFGTIPAESTWNLSSTTDGSLPAGGFVYYCDNETVDGVEFPEFPPGLNDDKSRLIVADMSSNILTRAVDISKYAVIFAGAQKNVGITDTTIIIVRKSILDEQAPKSYLLPTPAVMHWPTLAKHGSLYNTLPIFSLYVAADVMKSLLAKHGPLSTGSQAQLSEKKATLIYEILDANPEIYRVCADNSSRSRMNICFRVIGGNKDVESRFVAKAEQRNLLGLKGHRSVGGIRISNYNSVSLEAMQKLAAFMLEFTRTVRIDHNATL